MINRAIEILIVEDSPTQIEHLTYLLEEQGYTVTPTTNGRQALRVARARKPTIVISDIMMPEMDGYALCRTIKSDAALKDIPVILVTDLNSPQDVVMGLQCCADNFITKPYDPQFLLARITQSLRNKELRANQPLNAAVEVDLAGYRYTIAAERYQILDLLIPTYEEAVRLNQKLRDQQKELAEQVQERTAANERLVIEIAEREQAEVALRKSEEKYRTLFDSIDVGVCTIEMLFDEDKKPVDYRFLEVNQSFENQTGIQNAPGRRMREIAPLHEAHWFEIYGKIALTGEPARFEKQAEQLHRWYDVYAFRVGKPQERHVAIHFKDITARKRAEEAINASEERFRVMVESVTDYAILRLSPEGEIVSWNAGAQRLKGYQANEIIGQHFSRFYPAEDIRSGKPEHELEVAAAEGRYEDEGWRMRKDGTRFWANVVMTAIRDKAGTLCGFSKITRDLTERKRAEEEIKKHREQLETANEELEAFSYSVSHDLRAPLRHVNGYTDLLLKHAASVLDEKGQRYLKTISESVKQMGVLIDDLLTFSRMGRTELQDTTVSLDQLVKQVLDELKPETEERRIVWEIGALPEVCGDRAMLRQVLINLLGNAVKYTRPRQQARIEIGNIRDGEHPDEVVIFVRDNGVGFDMQYAHKLFGVFQRLHGATEFEGTGIGLALVQRVIRKHGGRIWAEGTVDKGATFYFTLKGEPVHG